MLTRSVFQRQPPAIRSHRERPLNPTADAALLNRLQDDHFRVYLDGLHEFTRMVLPLAGVSFNADPDSGPPLPAHDEWSFLVSDLFQALVTEGAALDGETKRAANEEIVSCLSQVPVFSVAMADASASVQRIFYQVMTMQGLVDDVNFRLAVPAYRYRMKNGRILQYAPSFPLFAFSRQLSVDYGVTDSRSRSLIDHFCIFLWNLAQVDPPLRSPLSDPYLTKLTGRFGPDTDKRTVQQWLASVQTAMLTVLPGY